MHTENKKVLLISMPFAGVDIPSIQLAILESYLKERNIKIKTLHLYLKAAEIYGLTNYFNLIYPPNDSYTAQIIYSKYLFLEHFKKNKEKFKEYFHKSHEKLSFQEYLEKTDVFYNWFFENINWQEFDIIGFSLNYGQFLPSLSFAKKIKETNPEKIIILGGSRTTGLIGERALQTFDFIDYIVSGDGEEPLYNISTQSENLRQIPGLIYRKNGKIISNGINNTTNINDLPIPSFDSYYVELKDVSPDIQQFFSYAGKLPIEISRGCWWNKCSFCNLNLQHKRYREKNVEKIVKEIDFLSNKYKMLNFQIIGNTLPVKDHKILCKKIIQLKKDLTFFAEARADHLKSDDYNLLKKAGFKNIQTGIESFSSNYLKKMNKGTRIIDNIAALKFCKENNIKNSYNLIVGYPNEEKIDFDETKINIELFKKYLEPPNLCQFRLVYESPIHCNPILYNIDKIENTTVDKIMFPQEIIDKKFNFVFDFKRKNEIAENPWKKLVSNWKNTYEEQKTLSVKRNTELEELVFYFKDGGNFIKIYDKRHSDNAMIYMLNSDERKVFLACSNVISKTELQNKFENISLSELNDMLNSFVEAGILYKENEWYLSLPISYQKYYNKEPDKKTEDIEEIREYINNL
jgi:ribosomal peptide maturation radical SAM protein 1